MSQYVTSVRLLGSSVGMLMKSVKYRDLSHQSVSSQPCCFMTPVEPLWFVLPLNSVTKQSINNQMTVQSWHRIITELWGAGGSLWYYHIIMHDLHHLPTNTSINYVHNRLLSTLNTYITDILSFLGHYSQNQPICSLTAPPSPPPALCSTKHIPPRVFFKHFQTATLHETFPRAPTGLSPQPTASIFVLSTSVLS